MPLDTLSNIYVLYTLDSANVQHINCIALH